MPEQTVTLQICNTLNFSVFSPLAKGENVTLEKVYVTNCHDFSSSTEEES